MASPPELFGDGAPLALAGMILLLFRTQIGISTYLAFMTRRDLHARHKMRTSTLASTHAVWLRSLVMAMELPVQ